jgi:hypothetical protein
MAQRKGVSIAYLRDGIPRYLAGLGASIQQGGKSVRGSMPELVYAETRSFISKLASEPSAVGELRGYPLEPFKIEVGDLLGAPFGIGLR